MIELFTGMAAYLTDHVSKRWAEQSLKENEEMRPLPGGRIVLRRLSNKGSAGGFFADKDALVTAGTASALISILVLLIRAIGKSASVLERVGLSLIVGGGAGNFKDRLKNGAVTDFISFRTKNGRTSRLVYNLADFAIMAGGLLCFIGERTKGKKDG